MGVKVPLAFTGLSNTRDRVLVGEGCFDLENCRVDDGILQADYGYTVQIAEGSLGTARGLAFGRYDGVEVYLAVIGGTVRKALPGDSAWSSSLGDAHDSTWLFQEYAGRIYGVNQTDGIRFHTIGQSDWQGGGKPTQPAKSDLLTFDGKVFVDGSDPERSLKTTLAAATWKIFIDGGAGSSITPSEVGFHQISFTFPSVGVQVLDIELEATISAKDLRWQDAISIGVDLDEDVPRNIHSDSLRFRTAESSTYVNPKKGTQQNQAGRSARRYVYFLGSRTERDGITKLRWGFTLTGGIGGSVGGKKFSIYLAVGDVWQNNGDSFNVDDGPVSATRDYAVSLYDASTTKESDLSEAFTCPSSPGPGETALGWYTRIRCALPSAWNTTFSPAAGDEIRFYRKRKSDGKYVLVGTATYDATQTRWENPYTEGVGGTSAEESSRIFIDDHYMEWELDSLTEYSGGFNLPPDGVITAIGLFRSSLGLGVDTDTHKSILFLSKVARPLEYEPVNVAPDPNDLNQGLTRYVDDTRSESVNMVKGSQVLFAGTRHRAYVMFGDIAKDLTQPRPIANIGPIGSRAHDFYKDGVAVIDKEGVWLLRFGDITASNIGSLETLELSADIKASFDALNVDSTAILVQHRGELLIIKGAKYLRLDRKSAKWFKGTFGDNIVAAAADYSQSLRLITDGGGLFKWKEGTTFGGTAIAWHYETGDIVSAQRTQLLNVYILGEGSPTLTITNWDGAEGASGGTPKTYNIDSNYFALKDFEAGMHYGTRFRLKFAGASAADKVKACHLYFDEKYGGEKR